jgi:pSer/pThr/pTyr-binding forkhead associated (FHA) protein
LFALQKEVTAIGRDGTKNEIILDDTSVSREQAKVRLESGDFYIYDLASTNATRVNGDEITKHRLQDGDRITLGSVELVFKRA